MKKYFALILLSAIASSAQSIRPSHWLTDYVAFVQARGYGWEWSPLTKPYDSDALLRLLHRELADSNRSAFALRDHISLMMARLRREPQRDGEVAIGVEVAQGYEQSEAEKYFHSINRLGMSCRLRSWLQVASMTIMDNRLDEEVWYMGIRQSGVGAYHETAYFRLHHQGWSFLAGRDFLRFGPGLDATLFLSDYSRPLDHFHFAYQASRWRYAFIAAQLDHFSLADAHSHRAMQRYLSIHRLEIHPYHWLHLALSEAVLYGSTAGVHWAYHNPLLFLHGEQMNGPQAGNILGSLQASWMPRRNMTVYADLLIDDIQIEKNEPGDYEPNEYGLTMGGRWADPLAAFGVDIFAEYSRVTQRTYNSLAGGWEKWLHRRQPLGHFLGNDFERWLIGWQYWPVATYSFRFSYEYRKKGEDRIENPFTEPWMEVEDYRHYSEPFPTGVVEKSQRWRTEVVWRPYWWLSGKANVTYISADHYAHHRGRRESFWQAQIEVTLEWSIKMAAGI